MIYRSWSLLSSTATIWGGAAAAGLAGVFLFGGKEGFQDYLRREGERLRRQDRATMAGAHGPWRGRA
ncbi:hypothetical protein SETIT_2G287300v2 [Setaria italica]|uniref:Uncharacterized protein n=2 Tax=Setaria TaxID=4554 RepID=A0A368Q3Q7_SETIT|nr:hypothetical protein SETIT_2G287300v2 [Setaria italica]TKW34305.1 hypothetical protein SEVIR_2G298000v2 [Setaria viridis]